MQTADSIRYLFHFNFLKLLLIVLYYVYICEYIEYRCLRVQASDPPGIGSKVTSKLWIWLHGCWKSNLGPLEEQQVLLTRELSIPV